MSLISREDLFLGAPCEIDGICKVHQLTINEIKETIGMEKYQYYINLFTMQEEDLMDLLKKKGEGALPQAGELTVFQYIMMSAAFDSFFFLDLKQGISTFIKEEVLIAPKKCMIIVGDPKDRKVITEKEFQVFSNALRLFNKMKIKQPPPENETPMQRKFRLKREERDRVKEKQLRESQDGDGADFSDVMSSLCTMNVGVTALNIGEHTIYQTKELLERAQARETYYTELDMLMAGADSKKIKPKHYVRNLQKEVN